MAVVYAGTDQRLDRPVAVKFLADNLAADPSAHERFVREGRLAARLSHPGVVAVYDTGTVSDRPFIVMELVEGQSLADTLAERGRLEQKEVARIGAQLADALQHAHDAGLVHRDVKPANVLAGSNGDVKIADFGIAAALGDGTRLTQTGTVLGTASYLAPEQAAGLEVRPSADVYALGVVLYELLTGEPPGPSLWNSRDIPRSFEELIAECLSPTPESRPTAGEVAADLRGEAPTRVSSTAATRVAPASTRVLPRPRAGRRPLAIAAAVTVVVLTAAGVIGVTSLGGAGASPARRQPAVSPVPHSDEPADQARLLARWVERYSR
jgi:eukaryotic-like serine/threonine-protein kinase